MEFKNQIYTHFLLSFISLQILIFNPSHENPLIVMNKPQKCGPNSPAGKCTRAAIIRGQTSIGLPSVCYNRVDPGPCGRDLIRVYYDWKTNRCKHFSYSGCGGNANRFVSIKNCYHICNPGYRTRHVAHKEDAGGAQEEAGAVVERKKVKLNVTQVQQIEVEMKK